MMTEGDHRHVHETTYRVRFDEAGPDGNLRTSGLMRFAQDLAWLHSTALGFGREWYAERGVTWLVRAAEIVVLGPIAMGTNVAARTEVVGMRRVFARRAATFRRADGSLAAEVTTDWVLIDDRGVLTRVPPVFMEMFAGRETSVSIGRVALPAAPPAATRRSFAVRRQEVDPYAHANNAVYLDWLDEAVAGAGDEQASETTPRRYRLEYALAAEAGATLEAQAWRTDAGTWCFRLRRTDTESDVFRATLEVAERGSEGDSET